MIWVAVGCISWGTLWLLTLAGIILTALIFGGIKLASVVEERKGAKRVADFERRMAARR